MYIITYEPNIEKLKDYEIQTQIKPPAEMAAFFRNGGESPLYNLYN